PSPPDRGTQPPHPPAPLDSDLDRGQPELLRPARAGVGGEPAPARDRAEPGGLQHLGGGRPRRGAVAMSVCDVLAFAVTLWISFLLSSFIRFVLEEDVFPHVHLQPGVPYALSTFVGYAMVFVGFVIALMVLGVNLDRVTVLGGALGVGVGFGLQNIVNNFVSGLIVLFERPVRVGDSV